MENALLHNAYYFVYLALSISITYFVGKTLFTNGRIFVLESFKGNDEMADSVNKLLLMGFYLVNIGFVILFLNAGSKPDSFVNLIEKLSSKIGLVLLILGGMHYLNMKNIAKMRSKSKAKTVESPKPSYT